MAKGISDNIQILNFYSRSLWTAVEKSAKDSVQKLVSSWVKIEDIRNGTSVLELAAGKKSDDILKILKQQEHTTKLVHYALAGDRQGMRPLLKIGDIDINTTSSSYIDVTTSDFVTLPLIGEAALLGLAPVVRKLLRKMASISFVVKNTPLYLYIIQNIQPIQPFYELLELFFYKFDFSKKPPAELALFLDAAYEKDIPCDVLRLFVANGLDLFDTDKEGHTLRDRILMKNAIENPRALAKQLEYVDRVLVDMAENGCVDVLQR